jgi:hypothetical protein
LEADTYIICVWVNSNPSSCHNKNPDQSGGQPIVSDVTKYACLYEDPSTEKDICILQVAQAKNTDPCNQTIPSE